MQFNLLIILTCGGLLLASAAAGVNQDPSAKVKTKQGGSKKSANILFAAPFGSKSHKHFYNGIIEALANDGHKVTVISPFKLPKAHPNVEEIIFEENDIGLMMANAFTDGLGAASLKAIERGPEICFSTLTSPRVEIALEDKFDLAFVSIFYNECFLGAIHYKKIPFVLVNPCEIFGPYSAVRMGNPVFPSFSFNPMLNFEAPLSFDQRILSTFTQVMFDTMIMHNFKRIDATYRQLDVVPAKSLTPTAEIIKEASLMIVNSVRLEEHPRPYMPNILLAGTIHCRPAQPLPKNLEKIVSDSGDAGFILFTIGSALRPSDIPADVERVLAKVFSELPQTVFWNHDKEKLVYVDTPANVKLFKWMPQQDLLGHPKIKLFITHGGLLSTQEAIYHGVPVLGLPICTDQEGNMGSAERSGWARKISWKDITEDNLRANIMFIIGNKFMQQRVRQKADLIRDAPWTPAQSVVWWTNYLLRHDGAKHLRSPAADLYWYELYNVDIWAVLVSLVVFGLWVIVKIIICTCRRCCCKKKNLPKKKNKEE